MGQEPDGPALAIMGSGETSPTMVTTHKELAAGLGDGRPHAVLLDAPYAFQENAADVTAKSQRYFGRSVGLSTEAVRDADLRSPGGRAASGLAAIRTAGWVFAGPGSPSYALARWRGSEAALALRDRISAGHGVTVFASAAAAACGRYALPVYEIYKAGADPYWLDGLDLLGLLGLNVALIPHYDNAEGRTHDTRYCYLGERRLQVLERELPADAAVLGVDEHTALTIGLDDRTARVSGRGGVTVRKAGISVVLPAGSRISLAELGELVRHGAAAASSAPRQAGTGREAGRRQPAGLAAGAGTVGTAGPPPDTAPTLPEAVADAQLRFDAAATGKQADRLAEAILGLEAAVHAWATDTDQNEESDKARAVLRGLVLRLGEAAAQGLAGPADRLGPAVGPLLELRDALRRQGAYGAADSIRAALACAGIEVRDAADGPSWAAG